MLARLIAGLTDWRTTIPGVLLLVVLAGLHLLGPDRIHQLATEMDAIGDLIRAVTGALGFIPGLVGVALLIWNSRKGGSNGTA